MNVKFKMPNFKRQLTGHVMAKEILMTFIGTTISIVLTFGTAQWLETRQKRAIGRQTAMMVILDIDETVTQMKDMAKSEKKNYELAQYVLNHLDQINEISKDTLLQVYNYIGAYNPLAFDDSKEKIFHSSQDSWKNINNAQFIDVVQKFYYSRKNEQDIFNSYFVFQQPLTKDEQYELMLKALGNNFRNVLADVLKEKINDPKTILYLDYSPSRQTYYNTLADNWHAMSNECRFLLGVTEEELQRFVDESEHSGDLATKGDLEGTWVADITDGYEEITFRPDGTFAHIMVTEYSAYIFIGQVKIIKTIEGTWNCQGDSLVLTHPAAACRYEVDKSQVSYSEQYSDDAKAYLKGVDESIEKRNKETRSDNTVKRKAGKAYIDDSDNMLELTTQMVDDAGVVQKDRKYMMRKVQGK